MTNLVWERRYMNALQVPASRMVVSDGTAAIALSPGQTLERLRWECDFGWRWFSNSGPGGPAHPLFVAAATFTTSGAFPAGSGPATNPNADWLSTRLLAPLYRPVPATPGADSFVEEDYLTGELPVDTAGRRRVPAGPGVFIFVVAELDHQHASLPPAAFSGGFYVSALIDIDTD